MRALTPEENERKQKMYRGMSEPILDRISLLNELKADIENLSRKIQLRQDAMRDSIDLDRSYGGNIENHVTPHNPTRETYTKLDGKLSAYDEVLELIEGYRAKKEEVNVSYTESVNKCYDCRRYSNGDNEGCNTCTFEPKGRDRE